MAKNFPIVTAGKALKKEKEAAATLKVASFVSYNSAGNIVTAPAGTAIPIIVDYSSGDGMGGKTYVSGDQVPVLFPEFGTEVNVLIDSAVTGIINKGDKIDIGANGGAVKGSTTSIGVALETITIVAGKETKILVEVLK